jgi:hypothetical protein
MYGPPPDSGSTMWFVDAPKFGSNANSDFDTARLSETLSCDIKFEYPGASNFQCGDAGCDGSFLIKS